MNSKGISTKTWKAFVICCLVAIVLVILAVALLVSGIQFVETCNGKRVAQLTTWGKFTSEIVIPFLAALATFGFIVIALRQLQLQTKHSQKQIAEEQFKKAIEHLGHDQQTVILGGVHSLHSLAVINEGYRKQTLDILCSFIRTETTKPGYKELICAKNRRSDQEVAKLLGDKNNRIVSHLVIQTIINLLFRQSKDRGIYFFPRRKIRCRLF